MSALSLHGVGVTFGGVKPVVDVTLTVESGERRAILGANGAGKTSLFHLISGDYTATTGSVAIDDVDCTKSSKHVRARRGLARTYQISSLFPDLTVAQHLELALRGRERGRMSVRRSEGSSVGDVEGLATRVDLTEYLLKRSAELAHGLKRQVEIGMALAGAPKVLLLDEPAAGLSAYERERLSELLAKLDESLTVLLVEHDMDVALGFADLVTVMHDGSVIMTGLPADVAQDELVQQLYLGEGHD